MMEIPEKKLHKNFRSEELDIKILSESNAKPQSYGAEEE